MLVPLLCLTVRTQAHGARAGGRRYEIPARRSGAAAAIRRARRTGRGPRR